MALTHGISFLIDSMGATMLNPSASWAKVGSKRVLLLPMAGRKSGFLFM